MRRASSASVAAAVMLSLSAGALAAQERAPLEQGKTVFAQYCAPCHGGGRGDDGAPLLPGTHALHLRYRGLKPSLLEERTDLTAEFIKVNVRNGVASMPPFRKTEVTDSDIAAIAEYLAATARARAR